MPGKTKTRVTLRDVARIAGVSVASVSLALRNSPRISMEKRERIAKICEQVGYVKDSRLSELMSHLRTMDSKDAVGSIAAVITHPNSSDKDYVDFKDALLASIRGEAERNGYSLYVVDMVREGISAKRLGQTLRARGIVGMVVLPSDCHAALDGFDYAAVHAVGIGYELPAALPHRVCANYLKMMDELMRDVLGKGHRTVAFIPEQSQSLLRNRMLTSSIDYYLSETPGARRVPVFEGKLEDADALRGWLSVYQPDLILGSRKAYERLVAMGYELPADFSFASWEVQGLPGSVAGLDSRPELIGKEAVQVVVDGINRNEVGLAETPGIVVVDSRYRSGASVGEPSRCPAAVGA